MPQAGRPLKASAPTPETGGSTNRKQSTRPTAPTRTVKGRPKWKRSGFPGRTIAVTPVGSVLLLMVAVGVLLALVASGTAAKVGLGPRRWGSLESSAGTCLPDYSEGAAGEGVRRLADG